MIQYLDGDITKLQADLLVNASNGIGYMGGLLGRFIKLNGVAESIHYIDHRIEKEAKKVCKDRKRYAGDIFWTSSGKLGYERGIIHAVTMDKPGQSSELPDISKCIENLVKYCRENKIRSIVLPILGSGVGGLNKDEVLGEYVRYLLDEEAVYYVVHYRA